MKYPESHVLIVADEGPSEFLAATVTRAEPAIAIAFARNRADAASLVKSDSFALVLLDSVGGTSSTELLPEMLDSRGGPAIIALVSAGDPQSRLRTLEGGALDALVKPVDPVELASKTRAVLALSRHSFPRAGQSEVAAEEQLAQAQKMEAVGLLAGGIAHDFNNILAVILSFAGFASEGLGAGDKRLHDLNEVIKAANRAARLTRQLLTVTSQQPTELEPTDLNQRLGELGNLVSAAAGPAVHITVALGVAPAVVELDPAQFDQVILNLVVNAREAMPDGGKLQLRVDSDTDHHDRKPRVVRVIVSDTGTGMDEPTQQRIFEPFFSTKGKGKGLGLATCFGIVEACGGSIRVSSRPGQGSTFTVEFPLSTHVPAKVQRAGAEPEGAGEHVLLVEDEATLLRALVRVFENAGYQVHSAADGEAAKRIIDELGPRLDAVVTDVILPGVGGDEVALHAARAAPGAAIFLTSGYLDGARNDGEFPILWKPIPPREIARTVARALSEKAAAPQPGPAQREAGAVVLIVEDDEATSQALGRILGSAGFTPKLAGNLREAREVFETQGDPEIVLCDLSLPDGSGTELLGWIHGARPHLEDRVFVLTGSAGSASGRQLIAGGSFPVLSKLTPPAQLLSILGGVKRPLAVRPDSKRPSAGAISVASKIDDSSQRECILIVNDDEVLTQAGKRMLRAGGFEVASASTRAEAVRMLGSRGFTALVLDAALAESTDPSPSDPLRHAQLPTVVLTTSPAQPESIRAARRQATEYLMKPFSADALRTAIRRVIDAERAARIRRQLLASHHGGDDFQADLAGTATTFDRALSRVEVAFQPIVRSGDGSVFGFEALLRCNEPGFTSPARLLAAAQVLGRQHDLGRSVRAAVATTLRQHPEREEVIFVNIDPAEVGDALLIEADEPLLPFARRVVLEISERAALVTDSGLEKRLARLRERGYRLALDDLGEGYSGLSSLATVLPDLVKIDTSLVRDIHRLPLKCDIVSSLMQAARRAGIIVVAEGVEREEECALLSRLGCDLMQGYLFAKPGPGFPVPVLPR